MFLQPDRSLPALEVRYSIVRAADGHSPGERLASARIWVRLQPQWLSLLHSLTLSFSVKPWPAASIYNIWNLSFIIQQRRGGDEHGWWLEDKRGSLLGNSSPLCACAFVPEKRDGYFSLFSPVNKIDSDQCFQPSISSQYFQFTLCFQRDE